MKQLGTVIEAYQIIFWLSDNFIRFFEHVNWLLYLIVLDFFWNCFNLSCLNGNFSKLFWLNWLNLKCVQRFILDFLDDRFDLINLNLYWFLNFRFYFLLNYNTFFVLLIEWLHLLTSIDVWIINMMMLLLPLSNWPKEADWSFIHSVIDCHPRLNSNWSYWLIENLLILLVEIALILILILILIDVMIMDLWWKYRIVWVLI